MRTFSEPEILALAARWRSRAQTFMREAEEAEDPRDTTRLAAMASSMNYAAQDLCFEAGIDPNSHPQPINPEAERVRRVAERELNGLKERQP